METDAEVINACLEHVASNDVDIAAAVYQNFASHMPQASAQMAHMDDRMRGRMLEQVYNLLLNEVDTGYLEFETDMHKGYGADIAAYQRLLQAVKNAVKTEMSTNWNTVHDTAWNRSIDRIVGDIQQIAAK